MKQLLVLAGFAVLLLGLAGCQNVNRGVEVIIEGGGEFPASLAGTWKAEGRPWKITLNPNGTVASVVIRM
ncbi:unnamed protein product, partial [marine sediment metagenome]